MLPILHQSLWRDEAFSIFLAEKPLNEIFFLVMRDVQAPLYYFILHYWMLTLGSSEVTIRSLSVIFHLALGILVFLFIHHLTKNTLASIFTSLATLFNPFLLSYSFEARPYSFLAFLTTLALYLFITKRCILASIVFSLAVLNHNFALFSLLGFLIYWIFNKRVELIRRDKPTLKEFLKLFGLPALTVIFWGGFVLNQWRRVVESFWINPTTSGIFLQTFEKFFGGQISFEGQDFLLTLAFILSGFVLSVWIVGKNTDGLRHGFLFLVVAVVPIVISYIISSLWVPNFHERYVIASIPLLILLSAISLHQLINQGSKTLSYIIISILVLYIASSIQVAEKIVRTRTKPSINYAVSEILKRAEEQDIIVPKEYLNFLETKYYVRRSASAIPVYAYSPSGEIAWYANATLIGPSEIIRELPMDKRVWQVNPDGGYELIK